MKVELENIRLGHSPLTDKVFAGIPAIAKKVGPSLWKHKIDITNDFIGCAIARWEGHTEKITLNDSEWEITVKKIK